MPPPPIGWQRLVTVALDETLDPAFRALALRLPGEDDMAQTLHAAGHVPDPATIHTARRRMADALAAKLAPHLPALMASLADAGAYSPDAAAAGRRALRLAALRCRPGLIRGLWRLPPMPRLTIMTEQMAALACLLDIGKGRANLDAFAKQWANDPLGDGQVVFGADQHMPPPIRRLRLPTD